MSTKCIHRVAVAMMAVFSITPFAVAQTGRDVQVFARTGPPPVLGQRLALVVGIDDYATLPILEYAQADADAVGDVLKTIGFDVLRMRVDGRDGAAKPTTAASIRGQAQKMAELVQSPDCTLLFYFSGHGFEDDQHHTYLCPHDTDAANLVSSALDLEEVHRIMLDSKAARRLLIVDMCRNEPGKSAADRTLTLERFQKTQGSAFLFSTAPGSKSHEPWPGMRDQHDQEVKNGLFTHFLLRGLSGTADGVNEGERDGFLTFREVAYFVSNGLTGLSAANTRVSQMPYLRWDGTAEDVLLRVLPETAPAAAGAGGTPAVDASAPQATPAAAEAEMPALDAKRVTVRIWHTVGSGSGRKLLKDVKDRMLSMGFAQVDVFDLNPRGMANKERMQRFVGNTCVMDLKPEGQHMCVYPKGAAKLAALLSETFPMTNFRVEERPEDSKQRVAEGTAADVVIDLVGLPRRAGK